MSILKITIIIISLFILGLKSVLYKIKLLKIKIQVNNKKYKPFLLSNIYSLFTVFIMYNEQDMVAEMA